MTIVVNNCYRYNYEMEFWLLKDYTAGDLLANWNEIINYANNNESDENADFLADCMDILCEKVRTLPTQDRNMVIEKATRDQRLRGRIDGLKE